MILPGIETISFICNDIIFPHPIARTNVAIILISAKLRAGRIEILGVQLNEVLFIKSAP